MADDGTTARAARLLGIVAPSPPARRLLGALRVGVRDRPRSPDELGQWWRTLATAAERRGQIPILTFRPDHRPAERQFLIPWELFAPPWASDCGRAGPDCTIIVSREDAATILLHYAEHGTGDYQTRTQHTRRTRHTNARRRPGSRGRINAR